MGGLSDRDLERVLIAVAHPDDAEFWAGGTIAGWTAAGIELTYCILTNGDAGGFDPSLPRDELPRIRQSEQQKAADILGVREVRFFSLPEGGLRRDSRDLHIDLVRMIRAGRGSARLTTLQGGVLTARLSGSNVVLTDGRGGTATVTAADLVQSNGVIHVTDAVSLPG